MIKLMICGKGGSGKTVFTTLAAIVSVARGFKVTVIDLDESNAALPLLLGTKQPKSIVEYLGGRRTVVKAMSNRERGELDIAEALVKAKHGVDLSAIPDKYRSSSPDGVSLVTVGKISKFFEGCACPINYVGRVLLKNLALKSREVVLVDSDAGIEHMGRGVEEGVDEILVLVDPTVDSLYIAEKMSEIGRQLGKKTWAVINRASPETEEVLQEELDKRGVSVAGRLRFDKKIAESSLFGHPIASETGMEDVEQALLEIGLFETP